jgi:hypothetical protein
MIGVAQEMVPAFRVFQKGNRKLPRQIGFPSGDVVAFDAGEGENEVGAAGPGGRLKTPR